MKYYLDLERLSGLVRNKRSGRGLRDVASEIGSVSPSTLSRVENGKMPDMETFLVLCNWLDFPPSELFQNPDVVNSPLSTPETIAFHLLADKNLDPAAANVLAILIKSAYREFKQ